MIKDQEIAMLLSLAFETLEDKIRWVRDIIIKINNIFIYTK